MELNRDRLVPLSPGEWAILACVWDLGCANAIEVFEKLRERGLRDYGRPSTAGTLLARVADKGYLAVETQRQDRGRPFHYYRPLVSRETALEWQLEKFFRDHLLTDDDVEMVASFLARRRG